MLSGMMVVDSTSTQKLIEVIAQRDGQIIELLEMVERQAKRIGELEIEIAKLKKNSANSSKPPSSDITKPASKDNREKRRGKRRRGGQQGHPKHERPMFDVDQVDKSYDYEFVDPQDLQHLEPLDEFRVIQQVELATKLYTVSEHRARKYRCKRTGQIITAPLPDDVVEAGLIGPRLSALIAYQKGPGHASYTTIQNYLRDVLDLSLSTGQLAKTVAKTSDALAQPYQEVEQVLPQQAHLGVDETGHKDSGKRHWTWCFRAELFTLFKIDPSRGSQVLLDTLGDNFNGTLGCDYFSAYRKYMGDVDVTVQFCLAHLIRDVKFLTTLPDKATQHYGHKLLDKLKQLFDVIHRREQLTEQGFVRSLNRARENIINAAKRPPPRREAKNMATRFKKHGRSYFTFITTPGIEPTNNLTEQAIRFVVIDRKITQGTRSPVGQRWCQRIWTVIATCAQQGRSVFVFLTEALEAHFNNQPPPSLLPVRA